MKILELEKSSPSVREAARLARSGIVLLTEQGKPAYALIGVKDDLALEALVLRRNSKFMAYLERVGERSRKGRTYSLDDLRTEFDLPAKARKKRL